MYIPSPRFEKTCAHFQGVTVPAFWDSNCGDAVVLHAMQLNQQWAHASCFMWWSLA